MSSAPASAGWLEATTSPLGAGDYELPGLAIIGGVPHVLYRDSGIPAQVYVKKLVAGAWVALGVKVNALNDTNEGATIVEFGGQPCVAYVDVSNNGTTYARVSCWTGSSWQQLGLDIVTGGSRLKHPQLVASGSDLAVRLIWDNQDSGGRMLPEVYRWSGGTWQACGSPGETSNASFATASLLQLVGGVPHVAILPDNSSTARIRRWSGGTSWVDASTFTVDQQAGYGNLAGAQYYAYSNNLAAARVFRWSGSAWEQQGGVVDPLLFGLNLGTDGTRPYLVFHPYGFQGHPYDWYPGSKVIAKRLVNGAWVQLQGELSPASAGLNALAFDGATPYVAWRGLHGTGSGSKGGDIHLSYWQEGQSAAILVPEADRAGIVEWFAPITPTCTPSTVDLWAKVDEYRDDDHHDCALENYSADYVESAVAPTAANRFAFELSAPPADLATATSGRVIFYGWKTGGKTATLTVWLRKADGTVVASSVLTPTATAAPLVVSLGPTSLSRADADGLYVEGTAAVSGGGSATSVAFSMVNVELTYDEIPSATPPAVTLVSPSGSVATQTPTLTALYNDSDPGDVAEVTFYLCATTGGCVTPAVVSGVAAGSTATWTPTSPLTVGSTYNWRAQAKDAAGNLSDFPASWMSFTVTAGTQPSITDNQTGDDTWRATNSGTYDVDFNAPQGLVAFDVRVYTGPNESGTLLQDWTQVATLSGTSHTANWALPASTWSAMVEGTSYVSVRLRDNAAQTAVAPGAFYVRKDTVTPSLTIASPPVDSYVNTANVGAFSLTGTCSENGLTVSVTGAATGSAACIGNGWTVTLNLTAAPQGALLLYADAQDAAGNTATTVSRSFIKDTVPPSAGFSSPGAGTFVTPGNQAALAVTGTCSEEGRTVALSGAATASPLCSGGAFNVTLDLTPAPQGALTLSASQSDAAGNSTTSSLALTKDTVLPTVTLTSPSPYVNLANRAVFPVSGSCSESGRDVVLSGAVSRSIACASGSWSTTLDLTAAADGPVLLYADHQDAVGNNANQASLTLTKDTVAPSVAFTAPASGSYVTPSTQSAHAVTGDCSESGRAVAIAGSGVGSNSCSLGTFSIGLDLSGAAEGAVSLTATHLDAAGNSASATLTLTKDVSPPVLATVRDGPGADLAMQTTVDTLEANWDAFADPHSGVVLYEWALGTAQGATDVRGFTGVGTQTSASASGLTLASGQTYFVTVRATNGAGLSNLAWSDGVLVLDQLDQRPLITREANDRAAVGIPYRYSATGQVRATSSSTVTFDTCGGPAEVAVDPTSGALVWTPAAAGLTSLCVRATNAFGEDTYSFDVTVVQTPPPAPVAIITTGPLGAAPVTITFDGSGSTAGSSSLPLVYLWSTDDAAASGSGAQWEHHFAAPAIFTTTLTVFDVYGQSASTTVTLDLRPPPEGRYRVGCGCDETGSNSVWGALLALFLTSLAFARGRPARGREAGPGERASAGSFPPLAYLPSPATSPGPRLRMRVRIPCTSEARAREPNPEDRSASNGAFGLLVRRVRGRPARPRRLGVPLKDPYGLG